MNSIKRMFLKLFVTGLLASFCAHSAFADVVVLTFEGLDNYEHIGNYYNGGAGGNYGITFGDASLALNDGFFANNPSGSTIAFFLDGSGDFMNVLGGFDTISFYYAAFAAGSVSVYSGLDGGGTLLASLALGVTDNPAYVWVPVGVSLGGTAHSVVFGGAIDNIGFDDITLGTETAGGGSEVPDSGTTVFLLGLAMLGLVAVQRNLSRLVPALV